jgi:beta-lactam-binding protein with PASTA domain
MRLEVSRGLAPNDFVAVPNLIGLFYSEGLEKIGNSNLKEGSIKFVDYKKSVPNIILNQNPKEGTKVSQNSRINLIISK